MGATQHNRKLPRQHEWPTSTNPPSTRRGRLAKRQWESLQSREQSNQVELFNYLEDLEATIADAKKDIEGLTIENLWLKHDIHQLLRHMEGYGLPRSAWEVVTKLCVVSDLQIIRENGSQVGRVTKVHKGDPDITNQ